MKRFCNRTDGFRNCSRCHTVKPLSEFYSREKGRRQSECKDCKKVSSRACSLRKDFGMVEADYERRLVEQEGQCAICHTPTPGAGHKRFSIDHDHNHLGPGIKIRSLLCNHCNLLLGKYRDDPAQFRAFVDYLSLHDEVQEPPPFAFVA